MNKGKSAELGCAGILLAARAKWTTIVFRKVYQMAHVCQPGHERAEAVLEKLIPTDAVPEPSVLAVSSPPTTAHTQVTLWPSPPRWR